ncbi:MAG TPA: S41 family peptidase [Anaerolineales bacterium]|nr:S41 family peptidase [Anaerolineales bacterium]
MNKKAMFLPALLLVLSFILSACMGLIPLQEEPAASQFGPATSLQEQQTKTFETLWKDLQDNYIYFKTADVDWNALHDKYLGRLKTGLTSEQFAGLVTELENELPKGSLVYQSRAERIKADTADTSSYEGIGAFVGFSEDPKPHIILLAVIAGSPAEKAGLKAHDSIFDIDGSPVLLEEGLGAVNRVRGPAGSSVTLGVQSPGTSERSVEVKRGKLSSTGKLEARVIEGTNYGYILFPPTGDSALVQEVTQSLQTFTTNRKLEGLILDLRIANSTSGWPLEDLSAMFYNGTLGEFYNRSNKQLVQVKGQDVLGSQKIPLVILVGKNTMGSPEIFAAGLQAQKRATVIGESTPGSVEASSSFYLPDGSQAFIETISFTLPNGDALGNTGVVPSIPVTAGWDQVLPNKDPVLDRAIKYLDGQQ